MGSTLLTAASAAIVAALGLTSAFPIAGFTMPTSLTLDSANRLYVSEKNGMVMGGQLSTTTGSLAGATTVALDLRSLVTTSGDFGLTSIDWYAGYLYATYSYNTNPTAPGCADPSVGECPVFGRVSRWPSNMNAVGTFDASREEVLIEGRMSTASGKPVLCAQFTSGGVNNVMVGPDGYLYVSAGAGSKEDPTIADRGQFSTDPCGTGNTWGGSFRAQDPLSFDGKIVRLNPLTKATTVIASGFHDPFRFAFDATGSRMFVADPGLMATDEITVVPGPLTATGIVANSGFPCFEGPYGNSTIPAYAALNSPVCAAVATDPTLRAPLFSYSAAPGSRAAISAITYVPEVDRVYYGDYMQGKFFSIPADGSSSVPTLEPNRTMAFPVEMTYTNSINGGMIVYIDIVKGTVDAFRPALLPSATPAPANGADFAGTSGFAYGLLATAFVSSVAAVFGMY